MGITIAIIISLIIGAILGIGIITFCIAASKANKEEDEMANSNKNKK